MPFPYKRILCPVDFDQFSALALREAASLALDSGATVHLLHVVQIPPSLDEGATGGLAVGGNYESRIEVARKELERLLTIIPPEIKREVIIEVGRPGDLILDMQAQLGTDLVVMATHGRKGFSHLVLGSVAERVVRESRAPVLTVRSSS
ncbi:MAG: universal stress protein [Deltaproteobacteria bacterium]|nr:universal stress protein [Deltaproteobacteria bacterium]